MAPPKYERLQDAKRRCAADLGVPESALPSDSSFQKYRIWGTGPAFIKPKPNVVLYDYEAFREWTLARMTPRRSTAADAAARRQPA